MSRWHNQGLLALIPGEDARAFLSTLIPSRLGILAFVEIQRVWIVEPSWSGRDGHYILAQTLVLGPASPSHLCVSLTYQPLSTFLG